MIFQHFQREMSFDMEFSWIFEDFSHCCSNLDSKGVKRRARNWATNLKLVFLKYFVLREIQTIKSSIIRCMLYLGRFLRHLITANSYPENAIKN